ncbi:hypothetical protein [Streptomyces sp. PT12]|uniref:hypothetical protein n=1 Tax=Streptomyces sp. PT12 TaxID=1510197 RepID=UPI000DE476DC|nr:hypothetical protein [Streptomyces sp. PT12]RBM18534.1 hypothetical protein DEH69_12635 [Streptomyces sp. PT12]
MAGALNAARGGHGTRGAPRRRARPGAAGRAYCSGQAHPSVARAPHILGFHREQLVVLPADASLRLPVDELAGRVWLTLQVMVGV